MPATTRRSERASPTELGVDPLRYFVLREYTLGGDGDFTYEALFQRYQSDLGNDLGNLLNRTLAMVHKYVGSELPATATTKPAGPEREKLALAAATTGGLGDVRSFGRARSHLGSSFDTYNQKIDEEKPWVLHKEGEARTAAWTCSRTAARRSAGRRLMVAPAIPAASREILRSAWPGRRWGTWPG